MITRQDSRQVYEAFAKAKELYMSQHPWEIFDQDQWDKSHWKQVVQLAQQQAWEAMKHYTEWMGETQGGLATAFDLTAFRLSMIAPVKKSVNHSTTVASMRETG